MTDLSQLPGDLPVPQDDGAADQLVGLPVPRLSLPSTTGETVALDGLGAGWTVVYLYPLTGLPDVDMPAGWDGIPGARGCTPEACDFRDHYADLVAAGVDRVFGLSSQDTDYQRELVDRLRLPFAMLSDPGFLLGESLGLPTFEADGTTLYRRLTLVILDGLVEHVFYPVFPPNEHARQVLSWLRTRSARSQDSQPAWLDATWHVVRAELPPAPATVVEMGCGTTGGLVSRLLQGGYDAVGVDPMAPAGPAYRQLVFERLDITEPVDAVVACTSLHHVADLDKVLSRVTRSLRTGGRFVVVEMDWERFDERTARWCFDRLGASDIDTGHGWLRHLRDAWRESGKSWSTYLRTWATDAGLHTGDSMVRALDTHLERRSRGPGPYLFAELPETSEADEQHAIDAGQISAIGLRYVGEASLPRR